MSTRLRLLCVGDNHGDVSSLERVRADASLDRFDLVVHTGGLTYAGEVGAERGRRQLEAVESVLAAFERQCPVVYVWGDRDELPDGRHVADGASFDAGTHVPADGRVEVRGQAFTRNPAFADGDTVLVTHEFRPYLVSTVDCRAYLSGHAPGGRHVGDAVSTPFLSRAQGRYEAGGYLAVELGADGSTAVDLRSLGGVRRVDCDRHASLGRQFNPTYAEPACRFAYREADYYYEHLTRAVYSLLRDGDRLTVDAVVRRAERTASGDGSLGEGFAAFVEEGYAGRLDAAFELVDGELRDALRRGTLDRSAGGGDSAADGSTSGRAVARAVRATACRLFDRDVAGWRVDGDESVSRLLDALHYRASARRLERRTARASTTRELLDVAYGFEGFGRYRTVEPVQDREELAALIEMLRERDVETVVEIGSGNGGFAYAVSNCVESVSTVVSVDRNHGRRRRRFLRRCVDADDAAFVAGDSRDSTTVADVASHLDGDRVDFLFVDAGGMREQVAGDFERYEPFVAEGGVVGIHDVLTYRRHPDFAEQHLVWNDLRNRYDSAEILASPHRDVYGIGLVYV